MATRPLTQRVQLEGGDKVRLELRNIGSAAQDAFQKLRGDTSRATPAARDLNNELERTSTQLESIARTAESAGSGLNSLRNRFLLLGGALTAAAAGFIALGKAAADSIVDQKNAADRIGTSIDQLRRVEAIGSVFGVASGDIQAAMKTIQDAIKAGTSESKKSFNGFTEVAKGIFRLGTEAETATIKVGDFAKTMQRGNIGGFRLATEKNIDKVRELNFELTKTNGTMDEAQKRLANLAKGLVDKNGARSQIDILQSIAETFDKIKDAGQRAFLAEKAGITALLPLIGQGSKAFKEYRRTLESLNIGGVLDKSQLEVAQDFQRVLTTIRLALTSNAASVKSAFFEGLYQPLKAVLDLMVLTTRSSTDTLSQIARRVGAAVGDIIRSLGVTALSEKNKVLGLDVGQVEVAGKSVVSFRETIISFATTVGNAITRIVVPAWLAFTAAVSNAVAFVNRLLGTNFSTLEVALGGVILKLTGFFKLLGGVVALASGNFIKFAAAAVAVGTLLSAKTTEEIGAAVQRIRDYFSGTFDTITDGGNKSVAALDRYRSKIASIKFPEAPKPEDVGAATGPAATVPTVAPPDKDAVDTYKQLLAIIQELRDAAINAYQNVKTLFTSASAEGSALTKIFDGLVFVINKLFGTEFTKGGLAIVLVFLQLAGVLTPLIIAVGVFFAVLNNLLGIVGKVGGGLFRLIGFLATLGGSFKAFGAVATGALSGVMVAVRALLGWPALLIAGLGLVYQYWDEIVAYASRAWDTIKGFVATLWDGFTKTAGDVWAGVTEVARASWAALQAVATDYWSGVRTVATATWAAITTVAADFWSGVRTLGNDTWSGFKTVASDLWTGTVGVAASYWQSVTKFGTDAWTAVKAAASGLAGLISQAFGLDGGDAAKAQKELVDPFKLAVAQIDKLMNVQLPASVQSGVNSVIAALQTITGTINTSAIEAAAAQVQRVFEAMRDAIRQSMAVDLPAILESSFKSIVSTLEALVDRVEELARRAEEAASRARQAAAEAASAGGGGGSEFASGGYVRGPGSGTSDSIPAWLSNGEFVVRAAAVRKVGVGFLRAINGLRFDPRQVKLGAPRFAMGGLVDGAMRSFAPSVPLPAVAASALPGKSFDLHIGGDTFSGLFAPEEAAASLQRYASQSSMRSAGRKPGWFR